MNIKAFRSGDKREFDKIFRMYASRLCYYVNRLIENDQEAEDIAVDSLAKLFERCMNFDSPEAIRSFLYKTARRKCLNYLKHKNVRSTHAKETRKTDPDNENPEVERKMTRTEVMKELYEAIPKLPPKCRKICELRYFDTMSISDISKKLNISTDNVGTQLTIALGKLRRLIKKQTFF